jgi:hypothetical protein
MRGVPNPEELQAILSIPQFSARARALEQLMATEVSDPHLRQLQAWEDYLSSSLTLAAVAVGEEYRPVCN